MRLRGRITQRPATWHRTTVYVTRDLITPDGSALRSSAAFTPLSRRNHLNPLRGRRDCIHLQLNTTGSITKSVTTADLRRIAQMVGILKCRNGENGSQAIGRMEAFVLKAEGLRLK